MADNLVYTGREGRARNSGRNSSSNPKLKTTGLTTRVTSLITPPASGLLVFYSVRCVAEWSRKQNIQVINKQFQGRSRSVDTPQGEYQKSHRRHPVFSSFRHRCGSTVNQTQHPVVLQRYNLKLHTHLQHCQHKENECVPVINACY